MVAKMFIVLAGLLPLGAFAQSVVTKKVASRIEEEQVSGYEVSFGASEEEVRESLTKFLKPMGRTRQSADYITISEPIIGGKKYAQTLYAITRSFGNSASAWIGMQSGAGEESSIDRDLDKLVYDFGITFHRERIQTQIDESLRALQAVEKQQARLVNQNKDLNHKIESNKREKIELEQSLVTNKIELVDLTKKLAANGRAQDSIAVATEQIRKVVEMHQERQRKVR